MGLLKRLLGQKEQNQFKEKLKVAQEEDRVMTMVEERKKSANLRELERYMKEEEEAKVKQMLDKIHKKNNQELWKSKNTILGKKTTILNNDRPILKEKNIFMDNKTRIPFTKGGENMFFKY